MLLVMLFSLVFIQGAFAELDCSKDPYDECGSAAMLFFVPTDLSEYNRLCPELPALIRCLKNFEDKCGTPVFDSEAEYDGLVGAFSDLCEEGTFLNRVVTENLRCFNLTFSTTSCLQKWEDFTVPYRTPGKSTKEEDDYLLPVEITCLQAILETDCVVAEIGQNCGQAALEASVEFLRRTFYLEDACRRNTAKYLLKNLDKYNLDEKHQATVLASLEVIVITAQA